MNNDFDEIMKDLPRVKVRDQFQQHLVEQVPLTLYLEVSVFSKRFASVAMAASLSAGIFVGFFDIGSLSTILGGLGIAPNQQSLASEWASSLDPYAATFDSL